MTYSFNLVDKPWIDVLYANGRFCRLSLQQLFAEAEKIREIAASNPTHRLSVLRFLSVVLVWLKPKEEPLSSDWSSLRAHILRELPKHSRHFELFDEDPRFFQSREARDKNLKPVGYLFYEVPTGTNIAHFLHVRDGEYGICPACCAVGLLSLCAFSLVGGAGYCPSPNPTSVYAFPGAPGTTLADRLRLGAQRIEASASGGDSSLGEPTWVTGVDAPDGGLLSFMTWHPRLVWLHEPSPTNDSCIICGQAEEGKLVFELNYEPVPKRSFPFTEPFAVQRDGSTLSLKSFNDVNATNGLNQALSSSEEREEWRLCFAANKAKPLQLEEWWASPHAAQRWETRRDRLSLRCKKRSKSLATKNEKECKLLCNLAERQNVVHRAVWAELRYATGEFALYERLEKARAKIHIDLFSAPAACSGIFSKELRENEIAKALKQSRFASAEAPKEPQEAPKEMASFVRRLTWEPGLKAGDLARLRALVTKNLSADIETFDLFTGLYWPIRLRSPRAPRRADAWLVVKLYARFPWSPTSDENHTLPAHLHRLWLVVEKDENLRRSILRRFNAYFSSGEAELETKLTALFLCLQKLLRSQELRTAAHPLLPGKWPQVDWARLLDELHDWNQIKYYWISKITKEEKQ